MPGFLNELWKIVTFLAIQYLLGRRGSFPYGLLVKFSLIKISLLVVLSDIIQTLALMYFFQFTIERWKWLQKIKERLERKKNSEPKRSIWGKLKKHGKFGLLVVAALPYGGGALSGSILALSMKIDKKTAFLYIITGCAIGTILYYLGFTGIVSILKID